MGVYDHARSSRAHMHVAGVLFKGWAPLAPAATGFLHNTIIWGRSGAMCTARARSWHPYGKAGNASKDTATASSGPGKVGGLLDLPCTSSQRPRRGCMTTPPAPTGWCGATKRWSAFASQSRVTPPPPLPAPAVPIGPQCHANGNNDNTAWGNPRQPSRTTALSHTRP